MADKLKQENKSQHSVPRLYLRGFADENQRFFRYNKQFKASSPAGVRGSACADYLYDLDPTTLPNPGDDPQWAEKTFSKLEGRFREVLDACISDARVGQLSIDNASYLAQFMAIQWMRTIGARKKFVEVDTKAKQAMVNQWYADNYPKIPPAKFIMDLGYEQALHANLMFDYPNIIHFAEKFWNLFWIVGRNRTDQPFYTSDEPVVRDRTPPENDSPEVPPEIGLEYAFPLDKEFIVVMFDRYMLSKTATPTFKQVERKTLEFGAAEVERYNALQVVKSTQYVFCPENKFDLANRLCREFPEICNPNRERVRVDSTRVSRGTSNVSITVLD